MADQGDAWVQGSDWAMKLATEMNNFFLQFFFANLSEKVTEKRFLWPVYRQLMPDFTVV